jgi:hypothetical protein
METGLRLSSRYKSARIKLVSQWAIGWSFRVRTYFSTKSRTPSSGGLAVLSYYNFGPWVPLRVAVPYAILWLQRGLAGGLVDAAYEEWLGKAVVLQVALGDINVPLQGKLLTCAADTVRMRIGEGWDVDIYKAMIVGVQADASALQPVRGGERL